MLRFQLEGTVLAGQAHAGRFTMPTRTPERGGTQAGVAVTYSDSIARDPRVERIPISVERRQTDQPGRQGIRIPCSQAPDNLHLPFWIQLVAAGGRYSLRQPVTVHTWTGQDEGGTAMPSVLSES